jgi:hypothetical protein
MRRGKTEAEYVNNPNERCLTFMKRRICLIKKAMQLSLISGCDVSLKIFLKEDETLIEYTNGPNELSNKNN